MALFEVYEMIGSMAHSVHITQNKEEAVKLVSKMKAKGKDAFFEQIQ